MYSIQLPYMIICPASLKCCPKSTIPAFDSLSIALLQQYIRKTALNELDTSEWSRQSYGVMGPKTGPIRYANPKPKTAKNRIKNVWALV